MYSDSQVKPTQVKRGIGAKDRELRRVRTEPHCQLKPRTARSSGPLTSRMDEFSGLPNCCLLLFIKIKTSESICLAEIPLR